MLWTQAYTRHVSRRRPYALFRIISQSVTLTISCVNWELRLVDIPWSFCAGTPGSLVFLLPPLGENPGRISEVIVTASSSDTRSDSLSTAAS